MMVPLSQSMKRLTVVWFLGAGRGFFPRCYRHLR